MFYPAVPPGLTCRFKHAHLAHTFICRPLFTGSRPRLTYSGKNVCFPYPSGGGAKAIFISVSARPQKSIRSLRFLPPFQPRRLSVRKETGSTHSSSTVYGIVAHCGAKVKRKCKLFFLPPFRLADDLFERLFWLFQVADVVCTQTGEEE